jgi:hypothetical protein
MATFKFGNADAFSVDASNTSFDTFILGNGDTVTADLSHEDTIVLGMAATIR